MGNLLKNLLPIFDIILAPFVCPAGFLLKMIRTAGVHRMPFCKKIMLQVGVFPLRNHYAEPLFDGRLLSLSPGQDRSLPGIDWDVAGQLGLLECLTFSKELAGIPKKKTTQLAFHFNNVAFESGDAEFLYNLIRLKKPVRMFEIGSGYSTLMAMRAIERNREEQRGTERNREEQRGSVRIRLQAHLF